MSEGVEAGGGNFPTHGGIDKYGVINTSHLDGQHKIYREKPHDKDEKVIVGQGGGVKYN
jgi:hypothetical protein